MKWTNVLFWHQTAGTKKLFHPFQKAQKVRKVIETPNKPVFKDKFLSKFLWRFAKYNLNEQAPHVGAKWLWIKRSRLTCTLTISCKLHLKPTRPQNPCKSCIQDQSSALLDTHRCFDNSEARAAEATISTLRPLELAGVGKLHITPHKITPLYRYSLRTLFQY